MNAQISELERLRECVEMYRAEIAMYQRECESLHADMEDAAKIHRSVSLLAALQLNALNDARLMVCAFAAGDPPIAHWSPHDYDTPADFAREMGWTGLYE